MRQLDEQHPWLRGEDPASVPTSTMGTPVEHLDLATVLGVSQAVSGELVPEKLIETLLRTAIEHAGAERGLLILSRGDELSMAAEAKTLGDAVPVRLREGAVAGAELPESVIQYAARTQESVILDDASAPGPFSGDAYIRAQHARSVLCLPLVKQGRLVALLYLENTLAPNVFTPTRTAVLKVLASQAAMSLENTRLYRDLEKREAKIRRLVDASIIGIFLWDLDGRILEANDAFLRLVGYERHDLTQGIRCTDLTPAEWRERTSEMFREHTIHGHAGPFEKEYLRKDGSRVAVLVAATAIQGTNGESVTFVLDLTERKRAEQERERLQQLLGQLAHLNRVTTMGELAASLAHEIRQPIAAAKIDASVCQRALADDRFDVDLARRAAARLVKDAERADEIIKRTTALYRKDTTNRERVEINALIHEMAVLVRQEARASSISIRTGLADRIPAVMADRVQLQQVFMNLMLNAIEAMKDSGGELTITSQPGEGTELLISVRDTGVELPTENPDQIFESFVTTKPHGTGMGLAISRSIVEAHGGRLWAIGNQGRGATFLFTLASQAGEHASHAG